MPKRTAIWKQAFEGMMKDAIFEATVAVLSEHGVGGMTMDRVAAAAGVAKGSLYRYFRSKRELLEFVHEKLLDPLARNLEALVAADRPAVEKLADHLRVVLEHVAQNVQVHKLLFQDDAAYRLIRSSDRRSLEVAAQWLAEIFRQGMEEGIFRSGNPSQFASMYLGLCRGILEGQPELDRPEQREEVHHLILGTLLHGIVKDQV